jgi:hypothetical protein
VFQHDEQKTIQLVKDVADVLENIAANSTHTPALYSSFLRALISAKTDPPPQVDEAMGSPSGEPPESSNASASGDIGGGQHGLHQQQQHLQHANANQIPNQNQPPASSSSSTSSSSHHLGNPFGNVYLNGLGSDLGLGEFQLDGEMGPVADMSTFPPTMMSSNHEDVNMGMLSMDNILSSGFWDSVLMPGACGCCFRWCCV